MIVIAGADIARRIYNFRFLLHEPAVFLELSPPTATHKTALATEQLMHMLAALGYSRTTRERLLGRTHNFSFELVSSRSDGIRFIVRLPAASLTHFTQQLASYLPEVHFREVSDYLDPALAHDRPMRLMEFRQARHFAYPLAQQTELAQHDPIAYITGSMTRPSPNEVTAYQLVLSPVSPRQVRHIRNKLLLGQHPDIDRRNRPLLVRLVIWCLSLPVHVLRVVLSMLTEMSRPTDTRSTQTYQERLGRERMAPRAQQYQELLQTIGTKLAQPLFQVSIRTLTISDDTVRCQHNARGMAAALDAYSVPGFQSFAAKRRFPNRLRFPYRLWAFRNRLPAPLSEWNNILSAGEVASLYHFPFGSSNSAENLLRNHSRTLPAAASFKGRADTGGFDVVLGTNLHHGISTPIGLTEQERERHMYIIGGTGNGKTTMLQYAIVQDMQNGKGLAIVDPHGDMAEAMLRHVPPERIQDVVYFNPDDLEYPIGLNLLELTPGLTGNELLREKDIITESVVSVFRKIFSEDDSGGHRIEYVLRNAIHTALTVEGATLFTVLKLLQNATYRKSITNKLEDEDLKDFWKNELGQAGNMQRVKMAAGITAKIGRFNANAAAKLILGQAKSTIDFEDIINSGKILICNFSKGLLGEDVSELFGITVLAKLQLASLRRARLAQMERRAFYLYVDEFQNFATPSFVQMLSESRKYRLFMTMAEQSTSQQKDQQMLGIILANVGTVLCFRTANPQDERLLLPLFSPHIEQGEIANLPSFSFYAKLSAVHAGEPLSGHTLLLQDTGDETVAQTVITCSREHYAAKSEAIARPVPTAVIKPRQQGLKRKSKAVSKPQKATVPGG